MQTAGPKFLLSILAENLSQDRLRGVVEEEPDWGEVIALALRHDVIPQLHQAMTVVRDEVPADVRDRIRTIFSASALQSLQLDGERRRLTAMLLAAGIPVIPWKGPVLAVALYGDVTMRSCVDLDLLVPPNLAWQALQLLQTEGYESGFAVPEQRWPALRRAVDHLALEHADRNFPVELHWECFHPMQVLSFDLSASWRKIISGGTAREGRLDGAETLVLLCAHGAVHQWEKLKWPVDIDRLVRRHPDLDWDRVLAIAERMGSRRCLLLGLLMARELCGTPLPEIIAQQLSGDRLAAQLASKVQASWFADLASRKASSEYLFHLRSRERLRDRLTWILRQLFAPRQADWQLFPLGSACYPLFYLERPLRMMWKWLIRPMLSPGTTVNGKRNSR